MSDTYTVRRHDGTFVTGTIVAHNTVATTVDTADGGRVSVPAEEVRLIEQGLGIPAAVVVDYSDGYVWHRDGEGRAFTVETATAFAAERNAGHRHAPYHVHALAAVSVTA